MSIVWAAPAVKRSVTIGDSQWRALLVMNLQHASNGFSVINNMHVNTFEFEWEHVFLRLPGFWCLAVSFLRYVAYLYQAKSR